VKYTDVVRWPGLLTLGAMLVLARTSIAQPLQPRVVQSYPHDREAFTQGLVLGPGVFYESTGLRGRSSLRRVNIATGVVEQQVDLPDTEFGEGLALVGQRLIQLTWREHIARVYDVSDFSELPSFHYEGEGWGLCYDGQRLVMSDGSSTLTWRDPNDFSVLGQVAVTDAGVPVTNLNELECVGNDVYANIWQSNAIVRIDGQSGAVLTLIQASGLLTSAERAGADVLNGIAFDPATKHFFLTGKLWPKVFEVEFPGLPPALGTEGGTTASASSDQKPPPAPQPTAVGLGGRGCACALGAAGSGSQGSDYGAAALLGLGIRWRRRLRPRRS
jgi:glutaminyl-peptide cyclotransferase